MNHRTALLDRLKVIESQPARAPLPFTRPKIAAVIN